MWLQYNIIINTCRALCATRSDLRMRTQGNVCLFLRRWEKNKRNKKIIKKRVRSSGRLATSGGKVQVRQVGSHRVCFFLFTIRNHFFFYRVTRDANLHVRFLCRALNARHYETRALDRSVHWYSLSPFGPITLPCNARCYGRTGLWNRKSSLGTYYVIIILLLSRGRCLKLNEKPLQLRWRR